jgi:hypothetical protein
MKREYPTLAERLTARGYRTGGFVANTIFCSYERGLNQGFRYYSDYEVSGCQFLLSSAVGRLGLNARWLREFMEYRDVPGAAVSGGHQCRVPPLARPRPCSPLLRLP